MLDFLKCAGRIGRIKDDDGEKLYALVGVPVPPYGTISIKTEYEEKEVKVFLKSLLSIWPVIWPQIRDRLIQGISEYETNQALASGRFSVSVDWSDAEQSSGDELNTMLSLQFIGDLDFPVWDFVIRGSEIVHFQPVS